MKYLIILLCLSFMGCGQFIPAKAAYVKKLARNNHEIAKNHHQLILHLKLSGALPDTQAMQAAMSSSQTLSKAAEISREPASISLPPGSGQMGKGLLGMLMGNPMAVGAAVTGLLSIVGGGIAVSKQKKITQMQKEGRELRDLDPDEAKKKWENSDLFGEKPA